MTSREYLSRLVKRYCEERYGVDTVDIDLYGARGETLFLDSLENLLADFESWRAVYEIRRSTKVTQI